MHGQICERTMGKWPHKCLHVVVIQKHATASQTIWTQLRLIFGGSSGDRLREVHRCWVMTGGNAGVAQNGPEIPPHISAVGETITILHKKRLTLHVTVT